MPKQRLSETFSNGKRIVLAKQRDWEKMIELSGGAQRSSYGKSRQRAQAKYARALLLVSCARWRLFNQQKQCWCDEDSSGEVTAAEIMGR